MKNYKSVKGSGVHYIIGTTILYDIIFILLYCFIDSYELLNLLKFAFIIFNMYEIYYIVIYETINYSIDESNIYINSIFGLKKEIIPFSSIKAYQKSTGHIKGVRLIGHGKNNFAIGKSFIDDIGIVNMFVTSNKEILYLNTEDINYGISPENFSNFENQIKNNGIENVKWNPNKDKNLSHTRDKKFIISFLIASVLVIIITLNPIVMYFFHKIPDKMPLTFNADFTPEKFGTAKQFAFKQMSYGLLNMTILFCMYYAGFLYEKYDKKASYKFIVVALMMAVIFLVMQIRILINFR
ncbi:hypothetical protein H2684_00805 [Clostridium sp. cel8]|uniref:PH domain-containing protein n=1 Tax=Clostridium sp. cel8 TaxID=2663123 RepID=UPI0015F58314|nr:hypothetical protein [Clostridium sp. cel8]